MDIFQITDVGKLEDREVIEWMHNRGLLKRQIRMGCFLEMHRRNTGALRVTFELLLSRFIPYLSIRLHHK